MSTWKGRVLFLLFFASAVICCAQITNLQVTVSGAASPSFGPMSNVQVGKHLRLQMWVPVNVGSPVTVTVTSSDDSKAKIASTPTGASAASATFSNVSTGFFMYVDGMDSTGTATLTASASGLASATSTVTLLPSGFMILQPGPSLNAFVGQTDQTIQICSVALTPELKVWGIESLQPGAGPVSVTVTSSNSTVGTVTTPVTFADGDSMKPSTFHAVAGGNTTVALLTPPGYSTPVQ